jgi:hypothetical protein
MTIPCIAILGPLKCGRPPVAEISTPLMAMHRGVIA